MRTYLKPYGFASFVIAGAAGVIGYFLFGGPEPKRCPAEVGARSMDATGSSVPVRFKNNFGERLQVFWLNYEGQRVPMTVAEPNREVRFSTWTNHPWVIADSDGDCLVVHYADGTNKILEINR